ncbi:hypothetical protein CHUAL_000238 [Chamberlinius hualienensis]
MGIVILSLFFEGPMVPYRMGTIVAVEYEIGYAVLECLAVNGNAAPKGYIVGLPGAIDCDIEMLKNAFIEQAPNVILQKRQNVNCT